MAARSNDAARQPWAAPMSARRGTNKSCPALVAAPKMPCTKPRRATNQRMATAAPRTPPTTPVPSPLTAPHQRAKVISLVTVVPTAALSAISTRPMMAVLRVPMRLMSEPTNGPASPYKTNPTATESPSDSRLQPNSLVRSGKKTPGATRVPAEIMMALAMAPATSQWREIRIYGDSSCP